METHFPVPNQCCQGAEISAAKHKRGRKDCVGPGKSGAEFLAQIYQQRADKGPNIFVVWFCTETLLFSEKHDSLPMINSILLYHFALCLYEYCILYVGPNFFDSFRSFWWIWPKSVARSWQHCS
jgi:hypothetical protein